MPGIFSAFTDAQAAGQKFGQDVQSKNILSEAYAGTTPEAVAKDPMEQQAVLQKASVLAGQKGLASLAHSFQKDASAITKDVQAEQIKDITVKQDRLNYAGQILSALPDKPTAEELNRAFSGITDETAQMTIQSIIRAPDEKIPPERKKQLLSNLTRTVQQNLTAAKIAADGEYKQRSLDIREEGLLLRERIAANKASNIKPAKEATQGAIKRQTSSLQAELGDIQTPDAQGNLKPLSSAQLSSVASRIENEGRQRYKNNPGDYSSVQEAVDEARDDIIAKDFPTTKTKKTIFGVGIPGTSEEERVYKPAGKQTAKPAEKKAATKTQKMPDAATLKDYADQHFGGDTKKAKEFLKSKGYSD